MKLIYFISFLLFSLNPGKEIPADLQQKASAENKNIAVYFCGSDWCSVCHKFKRELLEVTSVDSLLNKDYIYYTADFPQKVRQEKSLVAYNEFLAEKLNPAGEFPVLVIADANWKVITKIYRGNDESAVIQKLTQFKK